MFYYLPIGTRDNTAVSAMRTYTVPVNANGALVQAVSQNVRLSLDSTANATASDGFQIRAGDPPVFIPLAPGSAFTAQQEAATAAFYVQFVRAVTSA